VKTISVRTLFDVYNPIWLLITNIHILYPLTQGFHKHYKQKPISFKYPLIVAVFLLGMANVVAVVADEQENGLRMDWFLGFGLTTGGDKLAEAGVDYDGDTYYEDLRAGELVTFTGGIVVYFPLSAWSLQTSIGYHTDSVGNYDDDITFDRYPLELIPFYN
jgi:hypothetical protein